MTAGQLIEELRKLPSDSEVFIWNAEFSVGMGIRTVSHEQWKEFFTGKTESGVILR